MPPLKVPVPSTGPPQALIEWINYLKTLLSGLPQTLPLEPLHWRYRFYLDEDSVGVARTVFPEASHTLEVSFETGKTRDMPVRFTERSARVQALVPFLKSAVKRMNPSERNSFETTWIDKLIKGAKDSGAMVTKKRTERVDGGKESEELPAPKKCKRSVPLTIVDSDSDLDGLSIESSIQPSIPKQTLAPDIVIPSTTGVNLIQNQQATLGAMGWQAWAPGAKEAHQREMNKLHQEGMEDFRCKRDEGKEKKQERKRKQAAERQRRHRAKKRAEKDSDDDLSDDNNVNVALLRGADAQSHEHIVDVVGTSRAGTQGWRAHRDGTRGGAVQKKAASVNWFTPFDKAIKGTISRWRVKGKNEWTADALMKANAGKVIAATGRTGILAPYPDITKNVKETLQGDILPELVINADQAGNYLLPAGGHTFHERGAKQVDLVTKDEKRPYTMMVVSSAAGDFLPIQAVWAGKTGGSLPTKNAEKMQEAVNHGFIFSSAQSRKKGSHFSTFLTMEDWGVPPTDVKFPSSLPVLRDATVRGLVKMYDFTAEGRKIVQQAWRKCEVLQTEWNLSTECLYGKASEKALRTFLCEDTALATEIANRCGATHLAKVLTVPADIGGSSSKAVLPEEDRADFDTDPRHRR
ncbi:hypothetical protein B0H13DRAFT_1887903 [Mycena leptocephala]|nr:hypothetical protein B0H13DRAFT_1887903 [Mycena leptocephala]